MATSAMQGCSTLWDDEKSEQIVDAGEGGAVAVLAERAGAVGLEDVEGESAPAGEHAGIGADARAVFAEGDVAAVVGGGLDPPMRAHRLAGAEPGNRRNGYGKKTVITDTGRIELEVPRDRQARFDPQLIAKYLPQ